VLNTKNCGRLKVRADGVIRLIVSAEKTLRSLQDIHVVSREYTVCVAAGETLVYFLCVFEMEEHIHAIDSHYFHC